MKDQSLDDMLQEIAEIVLREFLDIVDDAKIQFTPSGARAPAEAYRAAVEKYPNKKVVVTYITTEESLIL